MTDDLKKYFADSKNYYKNGDIFSAGTQIGLAANLLCPGKGDEVTPNNEE
jgi:hypothetical protein